MTLVRVTEGEVAALAALHAAAFEHPWSAEDLSEVLGSPGALGLGALEGGALRGFILVRAVAGEAEVLTLAVDPAARRQGLGRRLLSAAISWAAAAGATAMFLEVDSANQPAVSLYRTKNFAEVGRRRAYYADGGDALVLRRELNSGDADAYERP